MFSLRGRFRAGRGSEVHDDGSSWSVHSQYPWQPAEEHHTYLTVVGRHAHPHAIIHTRTLISINRNALNVEGMIVKWCRIWKWEWWGGDRRDGRSFYSCCSRWPRADNNSAAIIMLVRLLVGYLANSLIH